jgi:hypothetical protein
MTRRGTHPSEETRRKMSVSRTGKHPLEATRRRLSESKRGTKNPAKRPEVRAKIRATLRGHQLTSAQLVTMSAALRGRRFSAEHIANLSGPNNHAWRGGIAVRLRSRKDRTWSQSVFTRDNYTCSVCGGRGGNLHAHHLLSWSRFPSLRFDLSNGITTHAICHYAFWHGPSMKLAG